MNIVAFFKALVAVVFGWAADALTWLRKPGSRLKVVCALLAALLSIASLTSYRKGQQVIVVTRQVAQCQSDRTAALEAAQLKRAELERNNADKDAALATIAAKLQAEAEKLRLLQERNTGLRDKTEAAKAAADRSAKAFKHEYDQRPAECTAALQALAAACPSLGGY
ncbi:hypothetical protein [Xanthomonas hortorum]|uniref:Uncharacterized protein n=1 Tax=Xanthomonas hortorum pv. vitians TaxID=83224 RepID=A0A6V7DRU9_9XANT|nr:hypothetical protein [Xanthomonas hortorum]MCE4303956.1 hypothetical protein [Xanthomonas hortorum pv. vitians]MCE4552562.1 hypothetical protein [Xanthomonas hortorum pv. vitians]MDT7825632.1 hypothetical protein [Xanthomonas hortorum pv. vitians]MDV7249920.1 hypothetical protein [Xanthomonas hortorum pv. vitians]NMI31949.1 hypothetical protein [Xanthomonas hortorum pv. vitians]